MHEVLYSDKIKDVLEQELQFVQNNLQIVTAYCKLQALRFIDSKLLSGPQTKRLMVRFRIDDIISGATDIEIYNYCKSHGWELYFQLDLHAKTYIFDQKRWIIGSANLTSKGIGLTDNCNLEMAMMAEIDVSDIDRINKMFDAATPMTDHLFELMQLQISTIAQSINKQITWTKEIIDLIKDNVITLFTYDFPKARTPFSLQTEDLITFHLNDNSTQAQIKAAFLNSRCYRWFKNLLDRTSTKELYFGAITTALHNELVNDPKPYRKDVKDLLANLLNWITELNVDEITVDRPNYSQIVRLRCHQ